MTRLINPDNVTTDNEEKTDIKVTKLNKEFKKKSEPLMVLDQVNFEVERGEFFCIVGPSGCGKSTLLKILLEFLTPTSGSIYLDPQRREQGIAYIPQFSALLPWRTLLQNAYLGLEIKGVLDTHKIRELKAEIKRYGLEGFENNLSSEISGGMKQKVDILRALFSKPKLLFCDEPFASIDYVNRLALNTLFRTQCNLLGTTTIFVTHNIEEAIFLGDKVAVMSQRPGRIVNLYEPKLSMNREDAVKCRESPEFEDYFRKIWHDLEGKHE